jgi:predicted nucleotidyltransferase
MRPTSPGQSALLLLDVIDKLNKRHIPYAIVGAFAASFHGMVRASLDADAVISIRTSQEAVDLCEDLRSEKLSTEYRKGDAQDPIAAVINIQDNHHNRVDLLIGIRGMNQEVFTRAQEVNFMQSSIKIVSLEDFIALKIFAGSPKDIQDVKGVFQVSGSKVDLKFLNGLVAQYGKDCVEKLQSLLKENH